MCAITYEGFRCGHAGPEGVSYAMDACADEATCSSVTFQKLRHGQGGDDGRRRCRCAECGAILQELAHAWWTERAHLESTGVPAPACQQQQEAILAAFKRHRAARIALEGPDHRAQRDYAALQETLIRQVRTFADRLRRADEDWDEHLHVIGAFGGPGDGNRDEARKHDRLVAEVEKQRARARSRVTATKWDRFMTGQQDALDTLYRRTLGSNLPARGFI